MITLSMAKAVGYTLEKPDGSYRRIARVDPYNKILFWDGLSVFHDSAGKVTGTDPGGGMMSWDDAKLIYDTEIVPTDEEVVMIERGRLCHQVADRAKALAESIDAWLEYEKRR
jgi:hypothetical protein